MKDTENSSHCTYIIDAAVNTDDIATLKKQLDKVYLKNVCHDIYEQCLITLLDYQNTKQDKKTSHKSNYIGVGDKVHPHKSKIRKETNDDTFRRLQKPVNPEVQSPTTSHFNVPNKYGQKAFNKVDVDYDKHT